MENLKIPVAELAALNPHQARLLTETFDIHTLEDLLWFFPHRYEDKTHIYTVASLVANMHPIQLKGRISSFQQLFHKGKKRLTATFADGTGKMQLVWFQRTDAVQRLLKAGRYYLIFGKPVKNGRAFQMTHPKIQAVEPHVSPPQGIFPLYPLPQKIVATGLTNERVAHAQREALRVCLPTIHETFPPSIVTRYNLMHRASALHYIHFAPNKELLAKARHRIKVEELLYLQLYLTQEKQQTKAASEGYVFHDTTLLKRYYHDHLPYTLTDDQKQVVKEIYNDMKSGQQMNRLLQGDVGSGKTIVAFLATLLPVAHRTQVSLIAPTEVLAQQHYHKLKSEAEALGISIALLTGSTPAKARKPILQDLQQGTLSMIIGTHALFEDAVQFDHLGLAIIDEQHRFGVAQRAKIWNKNPTHLPPHILVMTATPIPRTLAMTYYGNLDISTIQQKPRNRKPILTSHHTDAQRLHVFEQIRTQIQQGHQAYVVYPRILAPNGEENHKDLMDGHESISRAFPNTPIGILHGKMPPPTKAYEMARFVKGETKIMVGTSILEVGINVPNTTIIVIENADRFGLAQLHQLRGRVGRGDAQSYCLLLTPTRMSYKTQQRIHTMVRTQDGFEIAQLDLQARGPGDLLGVQQSGLYKLKLADLTHDHQALAQAQKATHDLLAQDPHLQAPLHRHLQEAVHKHATNAHWRRIS